MTRLYEAGERIGDYEIEGLLGSGGMGTVYRARHLLLNREVALKVLLPHLAADADFRERFRREARVMAGFDLPGLVSIYDARELDDQTLLIAMQLISGETLRARLDRELLLPHAEVAAAVARIADGLDGLHAGGVVHRDVKPSNVLLDEQGEAFLGDFGVSRAAADVTLTGTGDVVGSLSYMSPQQRAGHPAVAADDLWALAMVAHECLSGSLPREGRPSPALPSPTQEVFSRALQDSPDQRFPSAGAFAQALASVLVSDDHAETPATRVAADPARATKQPISAETVIAGTAVMPASGAAGSAHAGARAPRRPRARVIAATAAVVALGAVVLVVALVATGGRDADATGGYLRTLGSACTRTAELTTMIRSLAIPLRTPSANYPQLAAAWGEKATLHREAAAALRGSDVPAGYAAASGRAADFLERLSARERDLATVAASADKQTYATAFDAFKSVTPESRDIAPQPRALTAACPQLGA